MASFDRLSSLLHALPTELYDEIYKLTFTPRTDKIDLTKSYRPPNELQVDRAHRAEFARKYYSTTRFVTDDEDVLCTWLASLRPEEGKLLTDVRLLCELDASRSPPDRYENLQLTAARLADVLADGYVHMIRRFQRTGESFQCLSPPRCDFVRVQDASTGTLSEPISDYPVSLDSHPVNFRASES